MKRSLIVLCLLPLTLMSFEPGLAQTAAAPPVAEATPAPDNDNGGYIKAATAEIALWRQKISDFNARVETSTSEAGQSAKLELATAWSALEKSSIDLSTASAADWDQAKRTYESAKQSMEAKWAKFEAAKT